jgi:acetyl-CoA carboxylase carboxyl transferase subunit alpha
MAREAELHLRGRLSRLKSLGLLRGASITGELARLQRQLERTSEPTDEEIWQHVELARHEERPYTLDYVERIFDDFVELHGDRSRAEDPAMITGLGSFNGRTVALLGQQKGRDTKDRIRRNYGMAYPEGYRKAMRVMRTAEKFNMPIIVFIDTPGAYPGIGAEERGQAEAIAKNIREMFTVEVPIICMVIGEGASGGALGVGVGDVILMLENSWYCVISPEGCAAILWKDRAQAERAAEHLKLTAPDLIELGIADEIIPEPLGGAHRNPEETFVNVGTVLERRLHELMTLEKEDLLDKRYAKFRQMGRFVEV